MSILKYENYLKYDFLNFICFVPLTVNIYNLNNNFAVIKEKLDPTIVLWNKIVSIFD